MSTIIRAFWGQAAIMILDLSSNLGFTVMLLWCSLYRVSIGLTHDLWNAYSRRWLLDRNLQYSNICSALLTFSNFERNKSEGCLRELWSFLMRSELPSLIRHKHLRKVSSGVAHRIMVGDTLVRHPTHGLLQVRHEQKNNDELSQIISNALRRRNNLTHSLSLLSKRFQRFPRFADVYCWWESYNLKTALWGFLSAQGLH